MNQDSNRSPGKSVDPELEQDCDGQATGQGKEPDESAVELDAELLGLKSALGDAEHQMVEYKEAMLRMQAEMENLRKRLIKDLERSRKRALENVMLDLLPVKDSLERGTETDLETATVESLIEGKTLIIRMLEKLMKDHGLEEINPIGQNFDPELHQAMSMLESTDFEPNTVMDVMQKGYRLHDRLIRPAMVVVSKGPDNN